MRRRAARFRALWLSVVCAALAPAIPPAYAQTQESAPAAEARPQLAPSTTLGSPDPAPPVPAPEVVEPRPAPAAVPAPAQAPPLATAPAAPAPEPAPSSAPAAAPEGPAAASPSSQAEAPKPVPAPLDPRIDTGPIVKPPVHAGDMWMYRRNTGRNSAVMRQTVARLSDEAIALRTELVNSPDSSTALYDREWNLTASGYNEYRPALRYYSFPLYAGKRWSINTAVSNFGAGQTGRVKGEAWATGWEQVEVPAGRFLALRIEIDIETTDPSNPERAVRVRETHWYVRTVLRAVKVESHAVVGDAQPTGETVEMIGYRFGD